MGEIPHCTLRCRLADNVRTVEDNRYEPDAVSNLKRIPKMSFCVKVLLRSGTRKFVE